MKNFLLVCAKVLFFLFCIVVAFALFVVSAYFSIQFYKYGLPDLTLEAKNTILIITVLAISVEVIKFVLSFTAPLIKHRDEEADAKISFALTVALILSILASLTYFLIVHETYSPTARIVNLFYETFLVPIGFDVCRTQIIFIFNCIFSILIEYFIILLPAISTLPFRPRLSSLTGKKSNFVMIGEVLSTISSKPIMALHSRFVKTPEKTEELTVEVKEEPEVKNLDEEVQPIKQIEVEDNGSEEEYVKEPVKDVKEDKTLNEKYEDFDTEREEKNNGLSGLGNSLNGKVIDFEDEKKQTNRK